MPADTTLKRDSILRLSSLFLRTLREDPADAEVDSHKLLLRAGYIRRAAPGIYSWLPLGLRVLAKIEAIIHEEMQAIGAQQVHFPALLPREPYEVSGRWDEFGAGLFRLKDRKEADMLLAPTHEEMFTLLVKDLYSSYKDLPLTLYQIQTKYRDEARPRAGLIRGREFIMKDSYTFNIDDAGLNAAYLDHRNAYERIFTRLGLEYVIVSAMAGAMGGSRSEEFLVPCAIGEDTFVRSPGGYAANVEAVTTPVPDALTWDDAPDAHVEDTPDCPTIEALVAYANATFPRPDRPWTGADTLKNVVYAVTDAAGHRSLLVIGVPGDREIDEKRLEAALAPAEAEPATDKDFVNHPELVRGYIGPEVLGLDEKGNGIRYLLDPRVVPGTRWITGANQAGKHVVDLVAGRDFSADGTIEAAEVREGDLAPDGSGTLHLARGIEMGHIFQLGRKYAEALDLKVLDENGKQVTVTMGSYGIGVTRALAALAELHHDAQGLAWPAQVAPAQVHIVATGKEQTVFDEAERIATELDARGVEVIYDDRPKVSPGVKFKDAELLGVPLIVVVGRGLKDGVVEVRPRAGQSTTLDVTTAVDAIMAEVQAL
ncbi:MAG: proline--tRNA ligase [Cellulomonadaceae bacterium]|jgi:prolyl-tRNA synthetase|nr:proline--tRNA ligase [Cellulomonadaceae bacterium]